MLIKNRKQLSEEIIKKTNWIGEFSESTHKQILDNIEKNLNYGFDSELVWEALLKYHVGQTDIDETIFQNFKKGF